MLMEYVVVLGNGSKVIFQLDLNLFYNGIRSSIRNITHGVPQGSILGSLLFILNVNDFSRSSDLLFFILFADDTSVFIEEHSYAEVIEILSNELLKVSDWLCQIN